MVSLSTVYVVSIILTSLAGMGSAFIGNKVYPIQGGAIIPPPTPEDVRKATEEAAEKARKYAEATAFEKKQADEEKKEEPTIYASEEPPVPQIEESKPDLKDEIIKKFNVSDDVAQAITDFIQTPVVEWKKIAETPSELRRKFVKTMTHPDQNKCPTALVDLCKIVYVKYSNMVSFINEDSTYVPYGDQTSEAMDILSNIE